MKGFERLLAGLLLLVLLAITAVKHAFLPFNHDSGIYVHAARTILDHGSLYANLHETNPPFFAWLTVLPVGLADWSGTDALILFRVMVYVIAFLAIAATARELSRFDGYPGRGGKLALLLFWSVLIVGIQAYDLGHRDHLVGMLVFPYVVGLAARFYRPEDRGFSLTTAVLLTAAIALNPWCIGIWVLGELAATLRGGARQLVAGAGNLVFIGLGSACVALVVVLEPLYFSEIIPVVRATYGAIGYPLQVSDIHLWGALTMVQVASLQVHNSLSDEGSRAMRFSLAGAFFFASQGAFFGFIMQSHFASQLWPFIILSIAPLALLLLPREVDARDLAARLLDRKRVTSGPAAGSAFVLLLAFGIAVAMTPSFVLKSLSSVARGDIAIAAIRDRHYPALPRQVSLIDSYASGEPFYLFSTNASAIFPALHQSTASWRHRYHTLWPLPAIARYEAQFAGTGSPDPLQLSLDVQSDVAADFEAHKPALVLVDTSPLKPFFPRTRDGKTPFDYLAFFNRSEAFRKSFSAYQKCGSFVPSPERVYDVWVRKGKDCISRGVDLKRD